MPISRHRPLIAAGGSPRTTVEPATYHAMSAGCRPRLSGHYWYADLHAALAAAGNALVLLRLARVLRGVFFDAGAAVELHDGQVELPARRIDANDANGGRVADADATAGALAADETGGFLFQGWIRSG